MHQWRDHDIDVINPPGMDDEVKHMTNTIADKMNNMNNINNLNKSKGKNSSNSGSSSNHNQS